MNSSYRRLARSRKSGSAPDEFREFFERRTEDLEKDTGLFLEWEDFVHGKKIECTDLFQGIFESLHRSIRGLSAPEAAYVVDAPPTCCGHVQGLELRMGDFSR